MHKSPQTLNICSDFHPRHPISGLCRGLFRAVFRTFAECFSLNIATFSARLRLIYGIFRIFAHRNMRNSAAPQQLEHAPLHSACTSFAVELKFNCKDMSKIALGTWAWGAGAFGGDTVFGSKTDARNLKLVFDAAMKAGLSLGHSYRLWHG